MCVPISKVCHAELDSASPVRPWIIGFVSLQNPCNIWLDNAHSEIVLWGMIPSKNKFLRLALLALGILAIVGWITNGFFIHLLYNPSTAKDYAEWGDSFGVVNSLASILALVALLYSIYIQRTEAEENRLEREYERISRQVLDQINLLRINTNSYDEKWLGQIPDHFKNQHVYGNYYQFLINPGKYHSPPPYDHVI